MEMLWKMEIYMRKCKEEVSWVCQALDDWVFMMQAYKKA